MKILKKITELIFIIVLAVVLALNYTIFVFPNSFAPAGIDGICTMIQDVLDISMGYLSLLVNIPLLIAAYIFLSHDFALKNAAFVLTMSTALIVFRYLDLSDFYYYTETGTSVVLAPVVAGTIRGIIYTLTLKVNAMGGGIDIIAAIVKKFKPYLNLMNIIFVINMIIALSSYFVYGMKLEPVICSIIYSFITSSISNRIQANESQTVKFEIITPDSQELCEKIISKLELSATIMDAKGAYSGASEKMVICVIDKKKVPYLEELILEFPKSVVFKSIVSN